MATLTYLGKKKNYGPLSLPWMTEPVKFDKNGFAKGIDDGVALAIANECPTLFRVGALKVAKEASTHQDEPLVPGDEIPAAIDDEEQDLEGD